MYLTWVCSTVSPSTTTKTKFRQEIGEEVTAGFCLYKTLQHNIVRHVLWSKVIFYPLVAFLSLVVEDKRCTVYDDQFSRFTHFERLATNTVNTVRFLTTVRLTGRGSWKEMTSQSTVTNALSLNVDLKLLNLKWNKMKFYKLTELRESRRTGLAS